MERVPPLLADSLQVLHREDRVGVAKSESGRDAVKGYVLQGVMDTKV